MKAILYTVLSVAIVLTIVVFGCNAIVVNSTKERIYDNVNEIPECKYGLLLGTTPQTRLGGKRNYFFKYRIDAAETLYKAGKIQYILISGDENSLNGVNEPECMKDSLVARSIPENAIIQDGKGFRTIDSVVRAINVFNANSFTVISQRFHNERALYLAQNLDLNTGRLQAFNAKDPTSKSALITYVREYFARVKMFLDIISRNNI